MIGRRIGAYRLEARVGEGATARVYRVHHTRTKRRFALKLFTGQSAGTAQGRFAREGRALLRIAHPNVVRLLDFGLEDDHPYLVMEWLEGSSLETAIRKSGAIPHGRTVGIATQVARGLAAVHAAGVIHRDLKPANIMLLEEDEREVAKIVDFGLVCGEQFAGITAPDTLLGTPEYMPPELVSRGAVSEQTDLYSFGAILFEMLTGEPPFSAPTLLDILAAHLNTPAPSLGHRFGELGALVDQLLEKDPELRGECADDIADALESLAETALAMPATDFDFGVDDTEPNARPRHAS